jgi:methenyltetrahydrofolate cyclohydrolase
MYLEQPLRVYLDDLASAKATPGGGSAAALSGAMGAGLASMVARLTLGKAEYAGVQQEIESLVQRTESLRERFQQLMQEDIDAYGRLSASFKLPHDSKASSTERAARTSAIQAQLVEAALVPLEVVERAAELVQLCQRIAEIGNVNILSDVGIGAMLASSAGTSAGWLVRINLRTMKDLELVSSLSDRLGTALERISAYSQQVTNIIGGRT